MFKFNKLGLALSIALKLKVRKFYGLIPMFIEVIGEKLAGRGLFAPYPEKG